VANGVVKVGGAYPIPAKIRTFERKKTRMAYRRKGSKSRRSKKVVGLMCFPKVGEEGKKNGLAFERENSCRAIKAREETMWTKVL